jgi:hypothetical protein
MKFGFYVAANVRLSVTHGCSHGTSSVVWLRIKIYEFEFNVVISHTWQSRICFDS